MLDSIRACLGFLRSIGALILLLPLAAFGGGEVKRSSVGLEHRVALVIGNADYAMSPLINPINDARAMTAKLKTLGFEVIERENLTHQGAGETLREFRSRLTPGSVALFFYAGHGVQVSGINYLPLVDAQIEGEEDVPLQSLSVSQVLDVMDQAKTRLNLVFLDACRDNPFARRFRTAARGLAKIDAPSGTIIAFATRPGSVASDGKRKNGLYTGQLLANIDAPNIAVEQMLKRVVREVKDESNGKQEPWMEGSIEGDFYFRREEDQSALELKYWDSIEDSKNARDYEAYLEQFPSGTFAGLARSRIAALRPQDVQSEKAAPGPTKPVVSASHKPESAQAGGTQVSKLEPAEKPAAITAPLSGPGSFPRVGSSWTYRIKFGAAYRTFTVTVKKAGPEGIEDVLQTVDGEKFAAARTFQRTPGVAEGLRETILPGRYVFTELAPYMDPVELQSGKQWSLDDNRLTSAKGTSTWPVKLKVAGEESIVTAAGKFSAIRVDGETPVRPVGPGKYVGFAFKFWYVPSLGRVAKIVRTTVGGFGIPPEETCELIRYELG